ncbi:glycosyltransferase family 4 protein [Hyphomicrobium sp. DY-1]|uniref:glycosyltransferase family 4 protein n=1 Tax=Hyphomicrobium sp. DY-1 TaxID=3075650 RepID=UPI0039C12076
MNRSVQPHIVIFNNEHWPQGSYQELKADRFDILLGAVDTRRFAPQNNAGHRARWTIGGLANKNPVPLVAAVSETKDVVLKLFGRDNYDLASQFSHLVRDGRLDLVGTLVEEQLPAFYRDVDCVVMTEEFAGWANLAAEAMSSGVPLICTPHGTTAFARDGETAIVVEEPSAKALRVAIDRMKSDPGLSQRLSAKGREVIERFDWKPYCVSLLEICQRATTH